MSEEDHGRLSDEDKASLGDFDAYLNLSRSGDGLAVSADFINVQIVTRPGGGSGIWCVLAVLRAFGGKRGTAG